MVLSFYIFYLKYFFGRNTSVHYSNYFLVFIYSFQEINNLFSNDFIKIFLSPYLLFIIQNRSGLMKRIVISALLASLVASQAVGPVEAKSKAKKKPVMQVDRDKNGIPDAWQKQYHLGYGKQVATKDHDRDGLTNTQEYQLRLNPTKSDSDRDGIKDGKEDADRDLLTNQQEYTAYLNPLKKDSDQDGISDDKEDQDQDRLTTREEFIVGTQPLKKDSDRDGITDNEEDRDQDTLLNEDEFELGSDPTKADSDQDGTRDDQEDTDQDGVQNNQELKRIMIKVTDTNKKKFERRYSNEHQRKELRFKDEIGITDVATLKDRLLVTPSMTEEELLTLVAQALQLANIKTLQFQVKFYNGQELESEDEHADDDGASDDSGDEGDDDSDARGGHGDDD
jgi:hypothetical protein